MIRFEVEEYTMQDGEIIKGLQSGGLAEQKSLRHIYREHFEGIKRYVLKNSGRSDEATDVFQDGVLVLYENVRTGKFEEKSSLKTYLYSVCRFIWLKKLKHAEKITSAAEKELEIADLPDMTMANRELQSLAEELLDQLNEDCRQVLKLSIYENLDMIKISRIMNYKNEQIARNKKFKCLKELKEKLKAMPGLRSELKSAIEK